MSLHRARQRARKETIVLLGETVRQLQLSMQKTPIKDQRKLHTHRQMIEELKTMRITEERAFQRGKADEGGEERKASETTRRRKRKGTRSQNLKLPPVA